MGNSLSELDRASRTEKVLFASSYEGDQTYSASMPSTPVMQRSSVKFLEVDRSDFLADFALRIIFQKPTKYRIEDPAN